MDVNSIKHQIYIAGVELNSARNDGFVKWEIKKQLYEINWLLEEIIKSSGTFTGEEDFLREREASKILRVLSK